MALLQDTNYDVIDLTKPIPETPEEAEDRKARAEAADLAAKKRAADEEAGAAHVAEVQQRVRPADADQRTRHAESAVARNRARRDLALAASSAADAAAVDDPSDKALADARRTRRQLDEATRDLEFAQSHASKVAGEIAAAERAGIRAEIDRLEKARGEFGVIDDSLRELAVEIGILACQVYKHIGPRNAARIAAQPEIDRLRRRIGEPTPNFESDEETILGELVGLALAAQGTSPGFLASVGLCAARTGVDARFGTVTPAHEDHARAIAARVTARRSAKGWGIVAKVASVFAVVALAALSHG